jgi:hypothetical protein
MKLDHQTFYFHSNIAPHVGQTGSPFFTGFLQAGHFGLIADARIANPTAPRNKPAIRPQISSSSFFLPNTLQRNKDVLKDSQFAFFYPAKISEYFSDF